VLIKKSIIFTLALLLSACGYHLRGALNLPAGLKDVYLEGASPELNQQFSKTMKISSIAVASSPEKAGMIVRIFNEDSQRRVLSLNAGGAANDFELDYGFDYEITDSKNTVIIPRQPLSIKREYFNNQQAIIAKDNEEMVIRNEMYQQAVRSVISRAQVALETKNK
jgi:LPS-assembly lipoprotein